MFRREKKHVERLGRRQISEKCVSSPSDGSGGMNYEVEAHGGPPVSTSFDRIEFDIFGKVLTS